MNKNKKNKWKMVMMLHRIKLQSLVNIDITKMYCFDNSFLLF
jgi:hypothetical protein